MNYDIERFLDSIRSKERVSLGRKLTEREVVKLLCSGNYRNTKEAFQDVMDTAFKSIEDEIIDDYYEELKQEVGSDTIFDIDKNEYDIEEALRDKINFDRDYSDFWRQPIYILVSQYDKNQYDYSNKKSYYGRIELGMLLNFDMKGDPITIPRGMPILRTDEVVEKPLSFKKRNKEFKIEFPDGISEPSKRILKLLNVNASQLKWFGGVR